MTHILYALTFNVNAIRCALLLLRRNLSEYITRVELKWTTRYDCTYSAYLHNLFYVAPRIPFERNSTGNYIIIVITPGSPSNFKCRYRLCVRITEHYNIKRVPSTLLLPLSYRI